MAALVDLNRKFVAASSVLASQVQGEYVLLHLEDGHYYGLNSVASHIWQLLQVGATQDELVRSTEEAFEVAHENCVFDVQALLEDLCGRGLVVKAQPLRVEPVVEQGTTPHSDVGGHSPPESQ